MKKIFILFVAILTLTLAGCTVNPFAKVGTPKESACTMEAKICPDGSAVGRQGPNCEFAPCPVGAASEQYSCQSDADCRLSCYWGGVNAKWYQENIGEFKIGVVGKDCVDGCAGNGMSTKCIDNVCHTFMLDKLNDNCPKRDRNYVGTSNDTINGQTGLANPASVNCEQKGGRVEIVTAADGSQSGICIFSDGSECEEWAFFRGECQKSGVNNINLKHHIERLNTDVYLDIPVNTQSFISDKECADTWGKCDDPYSYCFLSERCVKPSIELRNYIKSNYTVAPVSDDADYCAKSLCNNCQHSKVEGEVMVDNSEILHVCYECDIKGINNGYGCKNGYHCLLGKCVKN